MKWWTEGAYLWTLAVVFMLALVLLLVLPLSNNDRAVKTCIESKGQPILNNDGYLSDCKR